MTTVDQLEPEDLTARARIRDAAMAQFGEVGYDRATIRAIADVAGVSSGLVRHHFGSKEGLREACEAHLTRLVRQLNERARAAPGGALNPIATLGPYRKYLVRTLTEGGAGSLYDEMVDLGEEWFVASDEARTDPPDVSARSRAAVSAAMSLGMWVLHRHLARGLGVDPFSPEGERVLLGALIELYSHPLLGADDFASARDALARGASTPGNRPEGDTT